MALSSNFHVPVFLGLNSLCILASVCCLLILRICSPVSLHLAVVYSISRSAASSNLGSRVFYVDIAEDNQFGVSSLGHFTSRLNKENHNVSSETELAANIIGFLF